MHWMHVLIIIASSSMAKARFTIHVHVSYSPHFLDRGPIEKAYFFVNYFYRTQLRRPTETNCCQKIRKMDWWMFFWDFLARYCVRASEKYQRKDIVNYHIAVRGCDHNNYAARFETIKYRTSPLRITIQTTTELVPCNFCAFHGCFRGKIWGFGRG